MVVCQCQWCGWGCWKSVERCILVICEKKVVCELAVVLVPIPQRVLAARGRHALRQFQSRDPWLLSAANVLHNIPL